MIFKTRRERNEFLKECYVAGLGVARRRHPSVSNNEQRFTYEDIVADAISEIVRHLNHKEFDSKEHCRAWFFLCLRAAAAKYRRHYSKCLSLDQPVKQDAEATFQDFIASRLVHPSLEDEEAGNSINKIFSCLSKDEKTVVQKIWIQELSIEEAAKEMKTNIKYIQRCLDKAKLSLGRNLLVNSLRN